MFHFIYSDDGNKLERNEINGRGGGSCSSSKVINCVGVTNRGVNVQNICEMLASSPSILKSKYIQVSKVTYMTDVHNII